jgi:phosphoserine phosphatase
LHILQNIADPSFIRLSTQEFLNSVRALRPSIAVFDCDGTLWSGDAGTAFMQWSMESGLLSREAGDWLAARYRAYQHGTVSELAMCGEMVQIYRGLRDSELQTAARTFYDLYIAPRVFPEMRQLCADLKAAGTTLWAVSSTNDWVVETAVQQHFGIPANQVLAARVRIVDGIVTDELIDVPTDDGKAVSLGRVGILNPEAVFGNSIHDAAMLALAQHPFAVNPSEELLQIAVMNGWQIYQPESTQQPG